LIRALEAIDTFKPNHVTLDAVSACVRMGSEQAAFDYLMRLVSILKERGISCIMTNQTTGVEGSEEELSGIGFSSVVDAVIQLRFVETDQEIDRQMLIVKSRGSSHSNRRRPFAITSRGIEFPDSPQPPSARARRASRNGGGK
jgi:circadian clock protein KaiC